MLRAVVISPDEKTSGELEQALSDIRGVGIARTINRYINEEYLVRMLRAAGPDVVFLSIDCLADALALTDCIKTQAPGTQIVAFHNKCDQATLLQLMRSGIREFLLSPYEHTAIRDALQRVAKILEETPSPLGKNSAVYTFLPSKAGVGCSTVALNASVALSKLPDHRVLLADFDLNSGMIGFMLKMETKCSVLDATENAAKLDEELWPEIVSCKDKLDVLPAGQLKPGTRIEPAQVRYLLDFARRNYNVISIDLSGMMERYAVEMMHEAKRIILVGTSELSVLHQARQKLNFLHSQELDDRVTFVLNRVSKQPLLSLHEIQELIGLPVHLTVPNDYERVQHALAEGKEVEPSSELGKSFQNVAASMTSIEPKTEKKKSSFLDYFSLVPARYSMVRGKGLPT